MSICLLSPMTPESTSDSANRSYATGLSLMSDFRYPVVNLNPDASVGCQDELTLLCKSTAESAAAAAAATTSMYPQDIADIFKPRFTTSEYPSELVFCSTGAASSGLAVQAPGSLEEMQALASMPGYGTGEMGFSAAALAMAAATAASSTPALLASEGVVSPGRCCGAGYSTAMAGPMVTSDACNGPVLGSGTMNGPAGMQPMSSGHSQLPYQIYAPAPLANSTPLMSFGDGQAAFAFGCSSSAQAPVPVSAPATGAAFCTPIMGSAQQQPADQLFGKLDYAAVSNSAAAGLLGFAAGPVAGHGADAAAARLGSHGVPSLAHTPQPDRSERPSPMALLGAYAVSPLTAASASPMVPAMASPMISSYFDGISLSSLSTPHMPTAYPAAARVCQGSCAVRPRLFRSLSTAGAHSRARSSSPSHLALAPGARAAGHPYLVHAHTTAGSETRAGHSKRASVHVDGVLNIARRLSIENAGCSPLNKAACASMSHAGSVISSGSCSAADADSAEDNDDDNDEAADKQQTSVSGRIPLTNEQREVFFRWLYANAHDPKPKGHERDRLRCIGNMSRERFKTWFANARRRYFVTSQDNGVLTYSVNQRFLVACQRAKIKLD